MVPQQYCLRWKHHHSNVQTMFAQLLEKERFCDVTLYCSPSFLKQIPEKGDLVEPDCIRGVSLRAHRVVLAACSELLGSLLGAHESLGEPVLVIDGAEPGHVRALLDYMYTGECHVQHSELPSLLKTAEELRIKGLTDIRWNNKDEPPDSQTGAISTTTSKADIRTCNTDAAPSKNTAPPKQPTSPGPELELRPEEKYNVNGGPPPLIKLPSKEKSSPVLKRDPTPEADAPSPKRQRMLSNNENSEDEDNEQEWHHGSLDISASRVINWGAEQDHSGGELSRGEGGGEDDDWGDAPADIGSFLDTRLRVDGDNSGDEDSDDGAPPSTSSSIGTTGLDIPSLKGELTVKPIMSMSKLQQSLPKPALGPKSGPSDPRFTDVIKLNDYLRHGRRPQFWEEEYVKRVMESVRLKELEMKQAAEILGVSYGTLYGRYRDVYGCINRPYRNARDFWGSKGPSEVLDRLQRGEISLDVAAQALGVTASHLAAYMADLHAPREKEFEPIPIEIDPSLKIKTPPFSASATSTTSACPIKSIQKKMAAAEKAVKKILIGSMQDEDSIPATVISNVYGDALKQAQATVAAAAAAASGKWPSIRVANLDTLRASSSTSPGESTSTSPTLLMKTRPDLTIVAAKKLDAKKDDENGT